MRDLHPQEHRGGSGAGVQLVEPQRETAAAFICAQRHDGWVCLPDRYDDGSFSGGSAPVGVRYHDADASVLYCVPEPGCDLSYLAERYTCFERTAMPSYEVVAGSVGRAVRAGAIPVPSRGRYRLTPEWSARVHGRDGEFSASEYAALEFGDDLEAREWPEVGAAEFVLHVAEYQRAADHTRQFLDRPFAGHGQSQRDRRWAE